MSKHELRSNQEVLAEINGDRQKMTRRQKLGAIAGAAALVAGLGVAGNNDYEAEKLTNENNQYIMGLAQKGGQISIPEKGGDGGSYIDGQGRHIQIITAPNGNQVHVDVATGQAVAEITAEPVVIESDREK